MPEDVRVLVLYHSMYGHIETMAQAVTDGVADGGAAATLARVPETMDRDAFLRAGGKADLAGEVIEPEALADFDGLILGTPTRFGNMSGQMRTFLDRCGGLWQRGALVGKPGGVFTSSNTQHGGQETTLVTAQVTLLHLGMVVVGLPYSFEGQTTMDEIAGGSPYGASTIAGQRGERRPGEVELAGARFQGRHLADIARRLGSR
jgi:NAD(P)H dehydrogenase (quinone)